MCAQRLDVGVVRELGQRVRFALARLLYGDQLFTGSEQFFAILFSFLTANSSNCPPLYSLPLSFSADSQLVPIDERCCGSYASAAACPLDGRTVK